MDGTELSASIANAYRRRGAGKIIVDSLQRLSAGASAETWRFDRVIDGVREPMVVQIFTGENQFTAALDKRTQGLVQQAAHGAGIQTPRIDMIFDERDRLGEGFVSAFVAGETLGQKITRGPEFAAAREALTAQCAGILAGIHAINTDCLPPLPDEPPVQMVARLRSAHDSFGVRLPVFELAFAWLDDHLPKERFGQLVHGDFRNGNFIVDTQGMVAVLDWEAAHLGDPLEDLGWLCLNAWRFGSIGQPVGGFGQRAELFQAYTEASGVAVDPQRVRFWEIY